MRGMYTCGTAHVNTCLRAHMYYQGGETMNGEGMATNVRLTNAEQEAIRQKAIEINKLLIKKGMQPLRDSELVHKILEKSVPYAKLNENGEVVIEKE